MGVNTAAFSKQLAVFTKKMRIRVLKRYRGILLDLGSSIVLSTPVLTGQARGNWQFTTSAPSTRYSAAARDPSGASAMARLGSVIARVKIGQTVYMANNAPYIGKLERGSSTQAPAGMMALNVSRIRRKYRIT